MRRIGALIEALRRELQPLDRFRRTGHVTADEPAVHDPHLASVQEVIAVHAGQVGASRQLAGQTGFAQVAIDAGHDRPKS